MVADRGPALASAVESAEKGWRCCLTAVCRSAPKPVECASLHPFMQFLLPPLGSISPAAAHCTAGRVSPDCNGWHVRRALFQWA